MACFTIPTLPVIPRYQEWINIFQGSGFYVDDPLIPHLSRLVTVLLGGEQSAVLAFERQFERLGKKMLHDIALEENGHEKALQALSACLPEAPDKDQLENHARTFFLDLGKAPDIGLYFSRVAELDTFTCKIMRQVEDSKVCKDTALSWLARNIKLDEAKHVFWCSQYYKEMGVNPEENAAQSEIVRRKFIDFLLPIGDSFEAIGVDTDKVLKEKSNAVSE